MQTFWDNVYLRDGVLFDENGQVGGMYGQPSTGLPFGRGFIIDRDGTVDLPYFGHNPRLVIDRIHELIGTTGVGEEDADSAANSQPNPRVLTATCYPNPFNPISTVRCDLPVAGRVTVQIHDAAGRLVATLIDGEYREAGPLTVRWTGRDDSGRPVGSGLYSSRITASGMTTATTLVLIR